MGIIQTIDEVFHPNSIAVVGAKRDNDYHWLKNVKDFHGPVYHVNIDRNEWPGAEELGFNNFASLMDIPEPVDYVIVSVPNKIVPIIVADAIKKGVKVVHLFTSGFGESHTEEGQRLGKMVTEMSKEAGLSLVGPNCMGVFNPKLGLRNGGPEQYVGESGPVGFISQSGMHCMDFAEWGYRNGIVVSKAVSYGNGIILDSTDYLEYLAQDEETRFIGMYVEGARDPERFFNVLKDVTRTKPVVIWKGGQTQDGLRAVSSHSANMNISQQEWEESVHRCGALSVNSMEELVDTIKALLYLPQVRGLNLALMGATGGHSVVMTDIFSKAGFSVPPLSEASYDSLASFFNVTGGSFLNPIDGFGGNPENVAKILEILAHDEKVDGVAYELMPRMGRRPNVRELTIKALLEFRQKHSKPLIVVLPSPFPGEDSPSIQEINAELVDGGVPTFTTMHRGAQAFKNAFDYYRFKDA